MAPDLSPMERMLPWLRMFQLLHFLVSNVFASNKRGAGAGFWTVCSLRYFASIGQHATGSRETREKRAEVGHRLIRYIGQSLKTGNGRISQEVKVGSLG